MCDNKQRSEQVNERIQKDKRARKRKERKKFINKLAIGYRKRKFNLVAKAKEEKKKKKSNERNNFYICRYKYIHKKKV